MVLDIDLGSTLAILTGDSRRVHFEPYFKAMYTLIVLGLFTVALMLLYEAGIECRDVMYSMMTSEKRLEMPLGGGHLSDFEFGDFRLG